MGNWTSVQLQGTCKKEEVKALRMALQPGGDFSNFHCLSNGGGVCGLGNWAAESISAHGNLAERGYDAESVKETLEMLARAAPSLNVKVHVGGDDEDKGCVATISLEGGKATIGKPEVEKIREITKADMRKQMGMPAQQ